MKKTKIALLSLAIVMLICSFSYQMNTPQKQAERFVKKYSAQLTDLLDAGAPLPEELSVKEFDACEGEHAMYQFTLTTLGDTYYGCYYSPDRVPLCFQNAELELLPDVRGGWSWRETGDNHGYTEELAPGWYYFEAAF